MDSHHTGLKLTLFRMGGLKKATPPPTSFNL